MVKRTGGDSSHMVAVECCVIRLPRCVHYCAGEGVVEQRGGASRADIDAIYEDLEVHQRLLGDCTPWSDQDDLGSVGVDADELLEKAAR